MIRRILLLVLVISTLASYGQKEFSGGLVFGPVTTQISGDGLGGWNKFGFAAGGWVNMPISEKSGVTVQMKYITKGSFTSDTLTHTSFGFYLNYIDVPVLYRRMFNVGKKNFSWTLGPYAGVLVSQKIRANKVNYPLEGGGYGPPFEKYDIGLMGGIAWWLTTKFYVDLSTSTSLLPTRPAPDPTNSFTYYRKGNYNQTLQLMIGIRFGKADPTP